MTALDVLLAKQSPSIDTAFSLLLRGSIRLQGRPTSSFSRRSLVLLPNMIMSNPDQACNFKHNVVPRRMDGYVDRRDLQNYLTHRWPNVELRAFKIRVSARKAGSHRSLTFAQERGERITFLAPEEVTKAEYESLIASVRGRGR